MKIGDIQIDFPVVLAPMAGYTDAAFRSVCKDFGCGMLYTEVVNAAGLVYKSRRTWHILETLPGERPIAAHIYGADPSIMADAATQIEECGRFDFIDINCGCPVRKIVAKGAGVALMRTPEKIEAIVKAVNDAVSIPVTIKTRIGITSATCNISEVAQAAEEGGASAIAIHGRFAENHHRGPVDWEIIAAIKAERNITVIGNGGIEKPVDALTMLNETGVDGVMIGRAAVGNPWLFAEIRALIEGKPALTHSLEEHRQVIERHLKRLLDLKEKEKRYRRKRSMSADAGAALHFRAHLFQYFRGFRNWSDIRRSLNEMNSTEAVMRAVDTVLSRQK